MEEVCLLEGTKSNCMNKILMASARLIMISLLITACQTQKGGQKNNTTTLPTLKPYTVSEQAKVMVLGTYHFRQEQNYDELSSENQSQIQRVLAALAEFQPTKVVLEWEPSDAEATNRTYQSYLNGEFKIDSLPNEAYQLGFRMARKMGHDSIYLFDDQTPFIGSLQDFSFDGFSEYANQHDKGFYDQHESLIIERYQQNQEILKSQNLFDNLLLRNSMEATRFNAKRMHMYEVRVGIQKSWVGPDWLGRFYQRNIRMMANVLKFADTEKDRILIIVGDNHKWVLDSLFEYTPDFQLVSSYDYLLKGRDLGSKK